MERIKKTKDVLDRAGETDQPKYQLIFESLKDAILSGEYAQGARLPSENDLVRRFSVSRMTIVKAIKELQQIGLVVRRMGSGTYVSSSNSVGTNRLFGLLIPELGQTEIFEPICQGMARRLRNSARSTSHIGCQGFSLPLSNCPLLWMR